MTTPVKYFHSAMPNGPVLSGTAGSLIAVLDGCLVNGFGLQTATSLVVASNVATLTFPSGHSFEQDAIMLVAGAAPAALNGEKRVVSTTTNTATFATTGVSDQTATGTVTAKLAPAGWEKVFTGTNLAAYRSPDVEGTRMFLRVDDTGLMNARVVGYESMTDVNTGVAPFPTATQMSGGGYWPKANASGAAARAWTVVADSKGFYLHTHTTTTNLGLAGSVWAFGDFTSLKAGDAFACALFCSDSDRAASSPINASSVEFPYTSSALTYAPRSYTALGGSSLVAHVGEDSGFSSSSGGVIVAAYPAYPNGPNNGIFLMRQALVEPNICRRGYLRGSLIVPQNCHAVFNWRDKLDGQGEYFGRKLMAVKCGAVAGTSSAGVMFFDINGPWA